MSSRGLVRLPVSCSAAVDGVNGCLTYSTCRSRNYYYQYSHTTNLQISPVDQMPLPRKLKKSIQRNAYFLTQKRKLVPHCSSDLSTSCRGVPNYLSINVLQDQSNTKQGAIRKALVILNPNSGFRSSRDVFYQKVQSTLKASRWKSLKQHMPGMQRFFLLLLTSKNSLMVLYVLVAMGSSMRF
ncbi:Sphingoid long-chain bases kinase 1 [Zea mays]|uniref:Sphingoid long-chain bases kinase 1 n=1 Tax=Zea mays TaxID=4577 RepID=A0A1D6PW86_MAIZE|nr:Sphingoid long-chain bases kinase 1 [Zea mays]